MGSIKTNISGGGGIVQTLYDDLLNRLKVPSFSYVLFASKRAYGSGIQEFWKEYWRDSLSEDATRTYACHISCTKPHAYIRIPFQVAFSGSTGIDQNSFPTAPSLKYIEKQIGEYEVLYPDDIYLKAQAKAEYGLYLYDLNASGTRAFIQGKEIDLDRAREIMKSDL